MRLFPFLALSLCLAAAAAAEDNALTPAERLAGFELLFDGRTLEGWQQLPRANGEGRWFVADGVLSAEGRPGDLATDGSWTDFELVFDWKLGEQGNSGVFYRADLAVGTAASAVEYQLADNARKMSQENPDRRNGAAYGFFPPASDASKPIGEWNHSRIRAVGPRVEHWLNGVKVVEYVVGNAEWKDRLAQGKFADKPDFAAPSEGAIVLQSHGDAVWFRNLKLRSLD